MQKTDQSEMDHWMYILYIYIYVKQCEIMEKSSQALWPRLFGGSGQARRQAGSATSMVQITTLMLGLYREVKSRKKYFS